MQIIKEFGLTVSPNMFEMNARVIDPPHILFGDGPRMVVSEGRRFFFLNTSLLIQNMIGVTRGIVEFQFFKILGELQI